MVVTYAWKRYVMSGCTSSLLYVYRHKVRFVTPVSSFAEKKLQPEPVVWSKTSHP